MLAGFLKPAERGEYLADWVDWLWTKNEEVVFTQTGGLMRAVAIIPPDLETASAADLVSFHDQHTDVLNLPGTGWTAWYDQWRWEDRSYLPACDFGGDGAAQAVDAARRRQFEDSPRAVFRNRLVVTLHFVPQPRDAILALLHDRDPRGKEEVVRQFLDQSDEYFRGLALICPSVRVLTADALGTYLNQPANYRNTPLVRLPEAFVAPQLATSDWEGEAELVVDGLHVMAVEATVFGRMTPLTFEALHELPFEARWTTTVHFLDPADQKSSLGQLRNWWSAKRHGLGGWLTVIVAKNRHAAPVKAEVERVLADIDDLEANMHGERDGIGIVTMTVRVWDRDPRVAEDRAEHVRGLLNQAGMGGRIATYNARLGALADIPGNASADLVNRRRPKIRLSTTSRCAPITGLTTGTPEDGHLGGPALLVAQSRRRVPLFWALHAPGSDVGHFAFIGPTGAGKSVPLSFMALSYFRYPGGQVTILDKGLSAYITTLCCDDGQHIELGSGGIGAQPLRDLDDGEAFAWAASWVGEALRMRQVHPSAQTDAAVMEALTALRRLSPDERTISALCAHMGGDEQARRALLHYTVNGPLGSLLDGVVAGYGTARLLTIEIGGFTGSAEAPLVFAAVFRQLERERIARRGHPKLVMVDEAGLMIKNALLRDWTEDMSRTGRKYDVQLGLFSQHISDFLGAGMDVVRDQIPTKIFTADSSALEAASARKLEDVGLTAAQIQAVANLRPKGEYLIKCPLYTRVADITLEGDALRICGASREIDRARALLASGVTPGREFRERWLAEGR